MVMRVFRFLGISFIAMCLSWVLVTTATTAVTWEKTFGGSDYDVGMSVQQTTDGGYIIAGATGSFGIGGSNVYLIKTDASGNELWSKTYGGSDYVMARCVQQTTDGGYIIAGEIVYEITGEDIYLVKTDASGTELWSKTFGMRTTDRAYSVQEANDGGYIIVGETFVGGGSHDVWLIKTDANGNELWNKTYGGGGVDKGRAVKQTTDGGYIIVGATGSFGAGWVDTYLIKTDGNGNELWHKAFGGGGADGGHAVQQTTDGGYIIVGSTSSFGAGSYDVWLIRTDANGNELWSKTFGGSTWDYGHSVQQTTDRGYIISGFTGSFGAGNADVWLIKTNASGNQIWSKTFGGSEYDRGWSVQQTSDEGYIIAGDTDSFGSGGSDVYLIYYKPETRKAMPGIPLLLLDTEVLSLRSSSFSNGAPIPVQHSLQGGNLSPPLSWTNAPANTKSFVVIMDDPDAPGGTWDHWIIYNIPAGTTSLAENAGASGSGGLPSGAVHGTNSWGNNYYQGPSPPSGTHRYYLKLYALSVSQLNPSGTTKAEIEAAMAGKILGQAELMGTYSYIE